jgi:hypothetical protein
MGQYLLIGHCFRYNIGKLNYYDFGEAKLLPTASS